MAHLDSKRALHRIRVGARKWHRSVAIWSSALVLMWAVTGLVLLLPAALLTHDGKTRPLTSVPLAKQDRDSGLRLLDRLERDQQIKPGEVLEIRISPEPSPSVLVTYRQDRVRFAVSPAGVMTRQTLGDSSLLRLAGALHTGRWSRVNLFLMWQLGAALLIAVVLTGLMAYWATARRRGGRATM